VHVVGGEVAADLNARAGALACSSAVVAIDASQALLAAIHFDGTAHDKLTAARAIQANSFAATVDRYNNNLLC
jgi:hypothetical protein